MIPKLIATVACIALLLALGAASLLNLGTQKEHTVPWAEKNSLKEIARRSKEQGKYKVTVPGPIVEYPGVNLSLNEALQTYTVVVADVIDNESYPFNTDSVRTWRKTLGLTLASHSVFRLGEKFRLTAATSLTRTSS